MLAWSLLQQKCPMPCKSLQMESNCKDTLSFRSNADRHIIVVAVQLLYLAWALDWKQKCNKYFHCRF